MEAVQVVALVRVVAAHQVRAAAVARRVPAVEGFRSNKLKPECSVLPSELKNKSNWTQLMDSAMQRFLDFISTLIRFA